MGPSMPRANLVVYLNDSRHSIGLSRPSEQRKDGRLLNANVGMTGLELLIRCVRRRVMRARRLSGGYAPASLLRWGGYRWPG
jgi:hypothetical protein